MVSERFLALPLEKQHRLINAGYKLFSQYSYRKASTEDIAREAGISKGYLFYYFHNKRALYLYLCDHAIQVMRGQVMDEAFSGITDFFELMHHAISRKARVIAEFPHLTGFILRAYLSQQEETSEDLRQKFSELSQTGYQDAFRNLDLSPFRPEVDPAYMVRLLHWMADGYMLEVQRMGRVPSLTEIKDEYGRLLHLMRTLCYKEDRR